MSEKSSARRPRPLPSIANAETFVPELNILQLEGLLFDFSRKHADKTADVVESNDATGRSVRLTFDPRYGRPSILAYRVLQAIFRKLTGEGYPFSDTVSFSRHEMMQFAGRSMGGAQSQELYRAVQQLRRLAGRTVKELQSAQADHTLVVKSRLAEMRYNKDLGDIFSHWLGGLKLPPRKSKILKKYGERLDALQATGLIGPYDVRKSATPGGFTLIVRPGPAFVADYLDLYLSRYQPRLKYQEASDQATIGNPLTLVAEFHARLNGADVADTDVFSEKDRAFAQQLIAKYGLEDARGFVAYALKAAAADGYPVRQLIGVRQYVNP